MQGGTAEDTSLRPDEFRTKTFFQLKIQFQWLYKEGGNFVTNELPKTYDPSVTEDKMYKTREEKGYYNAEL